MIRTGSATRRRVLPAAALAVVAALGLSGCGSDLHPGAAATIQHDGVDGAGSLDTTIGEDQVDDLTSAFCDYVEIANSANSQSAPVAVSTIRSQLLNALIAFDLMSSLADSRGLTMREADITAASKVVNPPLPDGLSESDRDVLNGFLTDNARATLEQSTLAANLRDPSTTTSEGVRPGATAGESDLVKNQWFDDANVEVNPSYGTWEGRAVVGGSGSLSDLVSGDSATPDPSSLPRSQVCG